MPWLRLWSSSTKDEERDKSTSDCAHREVKPESDDHNSKVTTHIVWTRSSTSASSRNVFTEPQTIVAAVILTSAVLGLRRLYKNYFKRVPEANKIKEAWLGKRSIFGRVTSVGDGDNFRLYHTPGGRLGGWGWLPGRRVPKDKSELRHNTIHVRLAGIDAPELAHFGKPAQPYGQEALEWLTSYVNGRRVRAYVHKADQYQRVVGTVYIWKGLFRRDVGLQMLRAGLATVYEAKTGVVFGPGLEKKYRNAEWWAKKRRKGMWAGKKKDFESPREYKTKHAAGSRSDEEAAINK